jgi:hypothetical protein
MTETGLGAPPRRFRVDNRSARRRVAGLDELTLYQRRENGVIDTCPWVSRSSTAWRGLRTAPSHLKIYSLTARFLRSLALSRAFLSALRIKLSSTSSLKNTRPPTFAGVKSPMAMSLSKLDNEMPPSRLQV